MAELKLQHIYKRFGDVTAVGDFNLEVADGEFISFLGPSGCGKTTILRMIAGFEKPTEGIIAIGDEEVSNAGKGYFLAPEKRGIGMVFQSYAVWPHMNVVDNVGYPLKIQNVPKEERHQRVMKMLELVHLEEYGERFPNQLSGGQQQRVALARALVARPSLLLLDEPLSNLDAKLRVYMRTEIRKIQQRIGITSVYVTHDQSEAMALSDKVIIMNGGHIEQVGSPTEIYQYPATHFVADFIGSANFVPAKVKSVSSQGKKLESKAGPGLEIGTALVEMFGQEFTTKCIQGELAPGDSVEVVIRPEAIELADDGEVKAEVTSSTYMGQMQDYVVNVGDKELVTETYNPSSKKVYNPGDTVYLRIQRESLHAIKK